MQVTLDCVDPLYHTPVYISQFDEPSPVQHRKISEYFNGTEIDFNIYLPHQGWEGRFFQLVFPTQNSAASPEAIGFGAEGGGYTVHVAGTGGYRADAAVAKISRKIARGFYQDPSRRIYGYIYGGSGDPSRPLERWKILSLFGMVASPCSRVFQFRTHTAFL